MSMDFGADGLASMRSRRVRFFPKSKSVIGFETRVFDDLADFETEWQRRGPSQGKGLLPLYTISDQ